MKIFKKDGLRTALSLLLILAAVALVILGAKSASAQMREAALETTINNLRRGAVACYALEGSYPESLEYLTENYGVSIDTERFTVHYEVFASNLMPDITVAER